MSVAGLNRCPVLCLFFVVVILRQNSAVSGECDAPWHQFFGQCYFFSDQSAIWTDARQACIDRGATLATITNQTEQDFIKSIVSSWYWYWIGLNDLKTEGTWVWEDGSESAYRNWKVGEPNINNQDCATLNGGSGLWDDYFCDSVDPYICQKYNNEEPVTTATSTEAPTTTATTTEAPPTTSTTKETPTTSAGTTEATTITVNITESPTSTAPTTAAPTTSVLTQEASSITATTTEEPENSSSSTVAPTTSVPTQEASPTIATTTQVLTTLSTTTEEPTTASATTQAPTTPASITEAPTTTSTTTEVPTTSAMSTEAPTTPTSVPLTPTAPASSPPPLRCPCTCTDATGPEIPDNMTLDQFKAQLVKQIENELTLNASSLASSRAKKTSAPDSRLSSQMVGVVASGIIASIGLLMFSSDLITIIRHCKNGTSPKVSPKVGPSGKEERA